MIYLKAGYIIHNLNKYLPARLSIICEIGVPRFGVGLDADLILVRLVVWVGSELVGWWHEGLLGGCG